MDSQDQHMHTRGKGKAGEEAAIEHLLAKGYTVVSRNYQTRQGEIDCIARDPSGVLVFVEVKVSQSGRYGHPLFWVTRTKQRRLAAMARRYRAQHNLTNVPCRFDVVAIDRGKVEHLVNAFLV